jgi:hypothetical protein
LRYNAQSQSPEPLPGFFLLPNPADSFRKATPMATIMKPTQSVDWTKERIAALSTLDVRQLRANAERLNRAEIMERCDEVLGERPGQKRAAARRKKKAAAAVTTTTGGAA